MSTTPHAVSPVAPGARIVGKGRATAAGPGPDVMAASTLDSDRVFSSDGEEVGKIKEIMLDVQEGRIAYAVMTSGGFLGLGNKLLAIPWSSLTLDTTRKCFLLNIPSGRVKDAAGFDKDHWPSMADLSSATTLYEERETDPWWYDPDIMSPRESLHESPRESERPRP
jgi:sporulation protein YlmC with PRC-barrel domain